VVDSHRLWLVSMEMPGWSGGLGEDSCLCGGEVPLTPMAIRPGEEGSTGRMGDVCQHTRTLGAQWSGEGKDRYRTGDNFLAGSTSIGSGLLREEAPGMGLV
jgi:hypothetical protein